MSKLPKLTLDQRKKLAGAKKYCAEQTIRHVMKKEDKVEKAKHHKKTQEAIQNQQVKLLMSQCFVGGVHYDIGMKDIREAFAPFGVIKTVDLNVDPLTGRHKGYAYVEYDLPESSQLAIEQMQDTKLLNRAIRVGRPTNTDQYQEMIDSTIEKSKNQPILYISNIHSKVVEDDLRQIFSPFGDVRNCVLIKDYITGRHKTYGFVEFATVKGSMDASETMNMFELNGKQIRVGRAMFPPSQIINDGPETHFERTSAAMAIEYNDGDNEPRKAIAAPGVVIPRLALELK